MPGGREGRENAHQAKTIEAAGRSDAGEALLTLSDQKFTMVSQHSEASFLGNAACMVFSSVALARSKSALCWATIFKSG